MKLRNRSPKIQFLFALILSSIISEALFAYGAIHNHSLEFDYLSWNLGLAWLPLIFMLRLTHILRRKRWSSWEGILLSILWLVFLPNSFYMISDFIHLDGVNQSTVVYDAVTLTSFIYTGVVLGLCSMFLVHLHLKRRLPARGAALWIAIIFFICSGAIYIGRDLRWSSWNILTNPGGLLFDISDHLIHIGSYPGMTITVLAFFALLGSMYNLFWQAVHALYINNNPVRDLRVKNI